MPLLTKNEIVKSIKSEENESIFIDPLLEQSQIGSISVDLRLGYDFLVSILTRKPYISISQLDSDQQSRSISSYFQETRREVGNKFILYPDQVVLTTTLEYISLPLDTYADILSRSSYTRLGIHVNTMVQPGFRGCVPLELFNHSNNAIELVVGSRIVQARFIKLDCENQYLTTGSTRKYFGDIRPTVSKSDKDTDLEILANISRIKKGGNTN